MKWNLPGSKICFNIKAAILISPHEDVFCATLTPFFFFSSQSFEDWHLIIPAFLCPQRSGSRCSNGLRINEQADVLSVLTLACGSQLHAMGVMTAFVALASPVCNRLLTAGGGGRYGSRLLHWLQLTTGSMHRHQGSSSFISQPAHLITPLIQPRRTITTFTRGPDLFP